MSNLIFQQRSCCKPSDKLKVIKNFNANVIPKYTQVQRAVNSILYFKGGTTQYGFRNSLRRPIRRRDGIVTFLGQTEGQPGGILGPLKNQF